MQQVQKTEKLLTITEFAELLGVKSPYVTQLIKDKRIPEARRDPEDNRYRLPNRRCIIPSKYPKPGRKVNEFYFRRDEVPEEWIEDPDSRPEPGVVLEGDGSESLASRIERTFGVRVGRSRDGEFNEGGGTGERPQRERVGKPLFPEWFVGSSVQVVSSICGPLKGTLEEANDQGVVLSRPGTGWLEGDRKEIPRPPDENRFFFMFIPWSAKPHIEMSSSGIMEGFNS